MNDETLHDFFNRDKKYSLIIPKYQRGYSWGDDAVADFWDDLEQTDKGDEAHFFGIIYTSKNDKNSHTLKIVDGQQRIITSAIFLICLRDYFYTKMSEPEIAKNEQEKAKAYFNILQEILYQKNDIEIDESDFLLTLSRTNKDFFDRYIVPKKYINEQNNIGLEATNDSNENLAYAYKKLLNKIQEFTTLDEDGFKKLNSLTWSLLRKFKIINWEVVNDLEAYRMFDLINNRGIQLADSDLVKNILFGKLDENISNEPNKEQILDDYDIKWSELRNNITGHKDSDYPLDVFFHHYLVFKTLTNIKLKDIYERFVDLERESDPKEIIDGLLQWSKAFTNLRNPASEFDKRDTAIHYLNKIKNIKSSYVYPVLMAGYEQYWKTNKKDRFDKLVEICFKYHIRVKSLGFGIKLENYQNKLHNVLKMIVSEGCTTKSIVNELTKDEDVYPPDDKLLTQLKTLKVSNSEVAIALLEEVEKAYDSEKHSGTDVSIEHIMPKNYSQWSDYILEKHADNESYNKLTDEEKVKAIHVKNCNMLGNQTLLSNFKNKKNSNKPFSEKKINYKTDGYKITKSLHRKTDWTEKTIKSRQEEFARILTDALDLKKHI